MAKQDAPSNVNNIETFAKKRKGPDPVLISLAIAIFGLLVYMAYSMFTFLSIIAILFAGSLAFYNILVRVKTIKNPYNYGKRRASFYSILILILPFIFGTIIAIEWTAWRKARLEAAVQACLQIILYLRQLPNDDPPILELHEV